MVVVKAVVAVEAVDDAVVDDIAVVVGDTMDVVRGAKVVSAVPSPLQAPVTSAVTTERSRPPLKRNAPPSAGRR